MSRLFTPGGSRTWASRLVWETMGPDTDPREIYAAAARLKRYLRAAAAGRVPGRNGRPIVSNHPRAEYWRRIARKRREMASQKTGDQS